MAILSRFKDDDGRDGEGFVVVGGGGSNVGPINYNNTLDNWSLPRAHAIILLFEFHYRPVMDYYKIYILWRKLNGSLCIWNP